jgi:hypothetical protein
MAMRPISLPNRSHFVGLLLSLMIALMLWMWLFAMAAV